MTNLTSDIWGATDKEVDPDVIEVPNDPQEAFELGLRWGVQRNLEIVQNWVQAQPRDTRASEIARQLSLTVDDLAKVLMGDLNYWANIKNLHRSDELARVARVCENTMKSGKIYADD